MLIRHWQFATACCALLGVFAVASATGPTYSVDAHIVASGTSVLSGNSCSRLRATVAEPVAGYSSSVDYAIIAGFRATTASATPDDIFFSSFEVCP
jgi:hypothetical protein